MPDSVPSKTVIPGGWSTIINAALVLSLISFIYTNDQGRSNKGFDQLSAQIADLASRINNQTTAIALMQSALNSSDKSVENLQKRTESLESAVSQINLRLSNSERDIRDLQNTPVTPTTRR